MNPTFEAKVINNVVLGHDQMAATNNPLIRRIVLLALLCYTVLLITVQRSMKFAVPLGALAVASNSQS